MLTLTVVWMVLLAIHTANQVVVVVEAEVMAVGVHTGQGGIIMYRGRGFFSARRNLKGRDNRARRQAGGQSGGVSCGVHVESRPWTPGSWRPLASKTCANISFVFCETVCK